MNTKLISSLRFVVSVLALVIFIPPVTANAYTSSGADGLFQPTISVVLNSTQSTFDFTNIFIPSGVTVSFSGLASAQPIELLATGNIDIAGTINMGANSLWIETPSSLSVSGSLNGSGSSLTLVASNVNLLSGSNISLTGTTSTVNIGSGSGTGGGVCTGAGATITITSAGAGGILSGNCSALQLGGVGSLPITVGGGVITLSPVPEPSTYAMLLAGLVLIGFIAYRRKNDSPDMSMAA